MTILMAARIVHLSIDAVTLWALFYLSVRPLLLDVLRQRLFAIRDDLFDFAADGGIQFNDPVYRELRDDINSLIRFAHKLSFARMMFAPLGMPDDHPAMVSVRNWIERANQLQPLPKRKLFDARAEVLQEVVSYIVRRSLVVYLTISALRLIGLFVSIPRRFIQKLPQLAESLEAQARDEIRHAA